MDKSGESGERWGFHSPFAYAKEKVGQSGCSGCIDRDDVRAVCSDDCRSN